MQIWAKKARVNSDSVKRAKEGTARDEQLF